MVIGYKPLSLVLSRAYVVGTLSRGYSLDDAFLRAVASTKHLIKEKYARIYINLEHVVFHGTPMARPRTPLAFEALHWVKNNGTIFLDYASSEY